MSEMQERILYKGKNQDKIKNTMRKKIKSKPIFYAVCLPELQKIAIDNGYNLLVHWSMNRDLDLVCVAWIDKPLGHYELLEKFRDYLGAMKSW